MNMLYPKITAEKWAKIYSINTKPIRCSNCDIEQKLTIPFACGEWRGLEAEIHECGENYRSSTSVNVGEFGKNLKDFFENLTKEEK